MDFNLGITYSFPRLLVCFVPLEKGEIAMLESMSRILKIRLSIGLIMMVILMLGWVEDPFGKILLFVPTYIFVSYQVLKSAFRDIVIRHRMSEQFLMSIATFGAFGLGDYAEALAVMVFYLIGQAFEDYAAKCSHDEISSLVKLKPTQVRLVSEDGSEQIVKPRKVKIGSKIRVLSGESIALDGTLVQEHASIDLSALNGESEPALFTKDQEIPSGGINMGGVIELIVTKDSKNSSITRLINLIEDAASNKSRPEALITRFSVYYTPIVVACAILLALVPLVVPSASFADWFTRALVFLVVSCPCALVLSVPLSFFGGLGAISKIGVMVKGSIFIEALAKLKSMAFDKTGTITQGQFKVREVVTYQDYTKEQVLSLVYALESLTTHPIGNALVTYCQEQNITKSLASDVSEITGYGLQGIVNGKQVLIGKEQLVKKHLNLNPEKTALVGTKFFVIVEQQLVGQITLADEIKENAPQVINKLATLGVDSFMITGDQQAVAADIAKQSGVKGFYAEQLPQDKLATLKLLKEQYQGKGTIAFVGDGINDAPTLASADLGIAMGKYGSACAVEAADVVVMNDDLSKIPHAIELAKKTVNLAMQNMVLIITVKLLILLLGALGFANIWLAILGDVGLCVIAVLNAMRTLTWEQSAKVKA